MKYTEMLRDKQKFLAVVLANPVLRHQRNDQPLSELKNKTLHLATISVRSDAVDGGTVPEDQVLFDCIISNSDVDSYGSIMTEQTLRNYAEDAARGVSFVQDHDEGISSVLGVTIAGKYNEESKQTEAVVRMLRDTDKTPDNLKVDEHIRRIEAGLYPGVSVSFRDAEEPCNICGKGIFDFHREDPCPHIPKQTYDGVVCTYNVDKARLRHVGLVTSPSNTAAKMLDSRNWTEDMRKVKTAGAGSGTPEQNEKSMLEKDGELYRTDLIEKALKSGVRAEDDFDEDKWTERFKTMPADQIKDQTKTWDALGDQRWGKANERLPETHPQSTGGQGNQPLILPSYLFEV